MKKLFGYIAGAPKKFSLRHRMANIVLIISALFGVQATIANCILGLPVLTIYGSSFFGAILFFLYYLSRFKNKLEFSVTIGLLIAIFFYTPVMWIGNAGAKGGAVFYIFLYGAFIISLMRGIKAWIYITMLTSVSLIMLVLEYNDKIKIYPYASEFDRFLDLAVSFTFVITGISIIIYIYTQQFNKSNALLREKNIELEDRNKEILIQKNEIETQRDEIETQRDSVIKQKEKIEEIHLALSDSIDYAKRIQESILPDFKEIKKYVDDFFVLFKPRDIVSGDFYWFTNLDEYTIIAAADCTGHGVPGAFMSVLGISLLHEIVEKDQCVEPGKILDRLRQEVISALNQNGDFGEQKDGMDIALICINNKTKKLKFAGANNPLYLITNNKLPITNEVSTNTIKLYNNSKLETQNYKLLYEIKPDKMPISIYSKMYNFKTTEIKLNKNDIIYLFSDGYTDQFGGEKNRKFMSGTFKELLLKNSEKSLKEQCNILETTIQNWKGNNKQIDDIMVLGIRI